ncbi:Peroxisomal membrane protein 4 [Phytophthora pseudosyringae]|uniref:Peroxisomal membrane protein 4 n=1 Tax=Phytophthora pseudosyringae TaxID=221518 RepID=A0A8T1VN12_9STRA|nr:Peroxisomal membrane protein 4 [Phytophthora pseudosyringae]
MKLHARRVRRLLAVLLIVWCALQVARAATKKDAWTKCIRSVPRSFTQPQQEQLCGPNLSNGQDPTNPGQCAKLALGGRPLQPAKFASRAELLRAASIIQLCSRTQTTGPAKCWVAIPAQVRQQLLVAFASPSPEANVISEATMVPLVQVCQDAQDDRPAQCLLLWLELSKTLSKRDADGGLATAVALCKSFGGKVSALKQCIKQTGPHLRTRAGSEIGVLQLCQLVRDGTNLPAVVECASELGRKHVLPTAIAQVCAGASGIVQPHRCFVEAQQRLKWMGQDAQMSLCMNAAADAAVVPINCALEMKSIARTLLPSNPSFPLTAEYGMFVSNLCRSATNATTVIECVRLVPAHAFTASQVLRLCAASTMPGQMPEDGDSVSLYPTSCAAQARLLLQRSASTSVGDSNGMGMSASTAAVHVCEQATSDAPSKCLADTQRDQALSAKLRVQLCRRATSDSPQLCVHSLRKLVNAQRMDIYDAVAACRQTKSLGPAECVMGLFQLATSATGKVAAQLCHDAKTLEPARCFVASPTFYDDELKVLLCNQAESLAPASCAESVITRFANQPSVKVSLCRGAASAAPAACAVEAPFGMDEASVVELCRSAGSTAPARCAQEVSTSLSVPWHRVAQVCAGSASTTPGRCLAHHSRHSRLLLRALDDNQVVIECRRAVARPAALGIAKASYNCPELRPMCPLQLVLTVLDQYGDPMVENYHQVRDAGVVYVSATFTGSYDPQHKLVHRGEPSLQGPSYATIANGSAVFSNLQFTGAGEFTLTFRAGERVTEEVARVLVHPDLAAEALHSRCDKLFTRFQCSAQSPPSLNRDHQRNELQLLRLPHGLQLSAVSCGQYWADNTGGLVFSGFSPPSHVLYALPRPLYDLFTSADIPRADMSAWALLGLQEGETNRGAIRRAYHQQSLQWHPDKWHALAATLPPVWQHELGGVYALVTQAYDQLVKPSTSTH